MLLAHQTDTHVLDPDGETENHLLDNNRRLALAGERITQETVPPRAVLATGVLTDHCTEVETKLLLDLLAPLSALGAPLLVVPGNHDDRARFHEAFDLPWASPSNLSWMVDIDDLRIIGLDTIIPGSHGGRFDEERRAWLTAALDDVIMIQLTGFNFLATVGVHPFHVAPLKLNLPAGWFTTSEIVSL